MIISVTLVSYNSTDITLMAIESILKYLSEYQEGSELIVVDNNSHEPNVQQIRDRFPQVNLICLTENIGFARGHNLAMQHARGDIIIIANSDILLENDIFSRFAERFCDNPKIGAIGPLVYEKDGSIAPTSRERIFYSLPSTMLSVLNAIFPVVSRAEAKNLPTFIRKTIFSGHESVNPSFESQPVEWVDGMLVGFSRNYLMQVGLFDSFYFFDHEIGDLLIRIRRAGGIIFYDSESKITHLGGYSRKRNPKVIHASLIGYLHYIYNNRKSYFYFIKAEIIILAFLKILQSFLGKDTEGIKLWRTILSDAVYYSKNPIDRENTIPALMEGR